MSGQAARVIAQAKLNLFLRVLAREESGYHQLETLFCRLDLGDDVIVRTTAASRSLDVRGPAVPAAGLGPAERNLAWRAAIAFADATGFPDGFAIEIDKRVPVGGGLGGGSADAGAVLRCLNALAPKPLARPRLLSIASSLGADVPFLTQDQTPLALGSGYGERLLGLAPLPSREVRLAVFDIGVPTADAYRWLDVSTGTRRSEPRVLTPDEVTGWSDVALLAENDFERVVPPRFAPIAECLLAWRSPPFAAADDAAIVLLSGSGSTVFCIETMGIVFRGDAEAPVSWNELMTRTSERVVDVQLME